jgi:peptidoglycan/LPS O-acetylase OafA/YrhL
MSKKITDDYRSNVWERSIAVVAALVCLMIVIVVLIRNQPFADADIAALTRTILSFAIAVLGAAIPGLLHIGWSTKGTTIRAAGALALFVLTYFGAPKLSESLRGSSAQAINQKSTGDCSPNIGSFSGAVGTFNCGIPQAKQ